MRRLAILAAVLAAGCGDDGPPLAAVRGTVTLDGKPLAGKSVRFVPEPGTPGQGAGANTGADGSYTLIAVRPGATRDVLGVPPGTYRVVVGEPTFPIDLPVQDADDPTPAPAVGPPAPPRKPAIPAVYGSPETTPLRVEVPTDGGTFDLKLSTRP